jgi:Zn-dependent protease
MGGRWDGESGSQVVVRGYEPVYYQTYGRPRKGILSPEEKRNLLIAISVLTLCLTMAMFRGAAGLMAVLQEEPSLAGYIALVALASTATAFFLHEMAHKFVAQRYGCWAEFRYSTQGLMIALLVSGLIGFLYAAPGAVFIAGRIDERQNGIISIAGPLTNVAVAAALLPLVIFLEGPISWGLYTVVYFNSFLAIFNMIPVMPLDGAKVLKWNAGIYLVAMVAMGALLFYVWIYLGAYIY